MVPSRTWLRLVLLLLVPAHAGARAAPAEQHQVTLAITIGYDRSHQGNLSSLKYADDDAVQFRTEPLGQGRE